MERIRVELTAPQARAVLEAIGRVAEEDRHDDPNPALLAGAEAIRRGFARATTRTARIAREVARMVQNPRS